MKVFNIVAALSFASVAALAFAGPASAITSTGNLQQDVHSALGGNGNITVSVSGNTVTLIGNANAVDKARAARVASSFPDVERVVDLVNTRS